MLLNTPHKECLPLHLNSITIRLHLIIIAQRKLEHDLKLINIVIQRWLTAFLLWISLPATKLCVALLTAYHEVTIYSVLTDYSHSAEVQSHSVEESVAHCRIVISACTVLTPAAIMWTFEWVIQPRREKKNNVWCKKKIYSFIHSFI